MSLAALSWLRSRWAGQPRRPAARPSPRRLQLEPLEARWVPANVGGSANQNWVDQIYRDILHRAASPTETAAWAAGLNAGVSSRDQVALGILGSTEGLRAQVNDLYLRFLHRTAEPAALAAWSG